MSPAFASILLIAINLGLIWLLMAAPLGRRTLRLQVRYKTSAARLWDAVYPDGAHATWHHGVLKSSRMPGSANRVEQVLSHPDRHGQPTVRVLDVNRFDGGVLAFDTTVSDDSALDRGFWKDYSERRYIEPDGDHAVLTVEQTDRYRGVAFLVFRFFTLRREMTALAHWISTGESLMVRRGFEHPVVQAGLAVVSTLLLWPFFGLDLKGLTISVILTLVIVLHELGHMAAYRIFGHPSARMIFVPLLGGIAIGGRPYNTRFEVAVCALMGAGLSAFLVPIVIALLQAVGSSAVPHAAFAPLVLTLLVLGGFNLLNLLPMRRFDGGQVLAQVFSDRSGLMAGTFAVTLAILAVGWRAGVPQELLLSGLAVFVLLSLIAGFTGAKPRFELEPMTLLQRFAAGIGLFAAIGLHGSAIITAMELLQRI